MELLVFFGTCAFFALIGVLLFLDYQRRQRQLEELQRLFPVREVAASGHMVRLVAEVGDTPGRPEKIRHMVAELEPRPRPSRLNLPTPLGPDDLYLLDRVLFGEFRYSVNSGKSRSYQELGFFYYPIPASFPQTHIRPSKLLPRIGDIHTEWEQFNRDFDVQSSSRRFALALLQPRMQEFLYSQLRDLNLTLFSGGLLLIAPSWQARDYPRFRSFAAEFERRVVPFLWKDFG